MKTPTFGEAMQSLLANRNMSLRELARRTGENVGGLSRFQNGVRQPPTEVAKRIDDALDGGGSLVALAASPARQNLTRDAANDSAQFAQWAMADHVDQFSIDGLNTDLARVASDYVHAPLEPLFEDLLELRDEARHLLQDKPHPNQARELYFLAGVCCTLLAHASQNLGDSGSAMIQAKSAEALAEQADHPGLRAWVAGTKALIAEWTGQPRKAVRYAREGQVWAPAGAGRVRLASLEARAAARIGDDPGARDALRRAQAASDESSVDDNLTELGGILSFPNTKAIYYGGSALTLLGDHEAAERTALAAIEAYETGPAEERSYGDEALARVDVSLVRVAQGDLEGAEDALRTVLELPVSQRIQQIADGVNRVKNALGVPRFARDAVAQRLVEGIDNFRP